jgi:uncharacterized protein YdhG (YjbR/CyaY superfamily)
MDPNKAADVDEYVSRYPKNVQALLKKLRETIRKAAPAADERISYGIPTFALQGNLVHFAGYKAHIGFYPGAVGIAAFRKELAAWKLSKGTVQFPLDEPLPLPLITRIVKHRVKQNLSKAKSKAKK